MGFRASFNNWFSEGFHYSGSEANRNPRNYRGDLVIPQDERIVAFMKEPKHGSPAVVDPNAAPLTVEEEKKRAQEMATEMRKRDEEWEERREDRRVVEKSVAKGSVADSVVGVFKGLGNALN